MVSTGKGRGRSRGSPLRASDAASDGRGGPTGSEASSDGLDGWPPRSLAHLPSPALLVLNESGA
eukprot:3798282-Karenia_brevis.AAC.1